MNDFHYVRTLGDDGGVDACAGAAIGLDMASVLQDGLPPHNVILQVLAGLCEILEIAEEDQQVHGDVLLPFVFVDDTGAVSLEGFGQRRTSAPEGRIVGHQSDLYGLGKVAFELFAGAPLPPIDARDADDHDDAVIEAVLAIPFGDLNDDMIGDVQWFIAKLLSHDPFERPSALETWRTFVAFAEEARGPEFIGWCLDALDGGGQRRNTSGTIEEASTELADDLGGPLVSKGPLEKGGLAFSAQAAAGGTAFFNKADMKAALAKDNAGDVGRNKPAVGGGSATNYWSRDQLQKMASGDAQAPRPKRAQGEGERRRTMATTKAELDEARKRENEAVRRVPPPAPPPPAPPVPQAPAASGMEAQPIASPFPGAFENESDRGEETVRMDVKTVRTTHTPSPAPQVYRPPNAPPKPGQVPPTGAPPSPPVEPPPPRVPAPSPGGAQLPVEPPVPRYEPEPLEHPDEGGPNLLLIGGIIGLIVVAIVVCAGLGGLSAALTILSGASGEPTEEVAPTPTPAPTLPTPGLPDTPSLPDTEPAPAGTAPRPAPEPTARPQPTPRPSPAPARPQPTRTEPAPRTQPTPPRPQPVQPRPAPARPRPAPEPAPAPVGGPATLMLKTTDRGSLSCGTNRKNFDGPTSMNFEAYMLPVTCLITIEGSREAFQVRATGSITCKKAGDSVGCDKSSVP